jgi:guanosine-3',5'-bis(diphosphate) 3'-pyrophosphohydrolase
VLKLLDAIALAERLHRGQVRKFGGDPYIAHPLAVARTVVSVGGDEDMACAAILHDVVEDCGASLESIEERFGADVMTMVRDLTSHPKEWGNRAARSAADRARLHAASPRSKTIKLADLLHNIESICEHDPNFGRVFLRETRRLLPCLEGGNAALWDSVERMVALYREKLYRHQPPTATEGVPNETDPSEAG